MKKSIIVLFLLTLLFSIQMPTWASTKMTPVAFLESDGALFPLIYSNAAVMNPASYPVMDGLIYPPLDVKLKPIIVVPATTKLRESTINFLRDNNLSQKIFPGLWADKYIYDCLENFDGNKNSILNKFNKDFSAIKSWSTKDNAVREKLIAKLNNDLAVELKKLQSNKAIKTFMAKKKKELVNLLKKEKITILGLDLEFSVVVNNFLMPTNSKANQGKMAAFFSKIPRFRLQIEDSVKTLDFPCSVYFFYPTEYIEFPAFADFRALISLPTTPNQNLIYWILQPVVLRDFWGRYLKDQTTVLEKASSDYAQLIFDQLKADEKKKAAFEKKFADLNYELQKNIISQKSVLKEALMNLWNSGIKFMAAKVKPTSNIIFIDEWDFDKKTSKENAYLEPTHGTGIHFRNPAEINVASLVADIDNVDFKKEVAGLSGLAKSIDVQINKMVEQQRVCAEKLNKYLETVKPVVNSKFKSFMLEPELKAVLDPVIKLDLTRAKAFLGCENSVKLMIHRLRALRTKVDMTNLASKNEKQKAIALDVNSILEHSNLLIHKWFTARFLVWEINDRLEQELDAVARNNSETGTNAYEALVNFADSLYPLLKEINASVKTNMTALENSIAKVSK